jgi:hypothetical protein
MFRSILAVICSLCFIYSAVVAIDTITGYAGRQSLDLNQQVQLLAAYTLPILLLAGSAALWVRVLKGRKRRRRWHPTAPAAFGPTVTNQRHSLDLGRTPPLDQTNQRAQAKPMGENTPPSGPLTPDSRAH